MPAKKKRKPGTPKRHSSRSPKKSSSPRASSSARVSKKIKYLRNEGVPQDQAVATALSMEREGRLDSKGNYMRKKKRKSKRPK